MKHTSHKIFFLPGAGGSPSFWKPVADQLPNTWEKMMFGWPGLGHEPNDQKVRNINALVELVEAQLDRPVDLVAQSMGGVVASRIALKRPEFVRRLVLTVTSAGVDMARFGALDWRQDYRNTFPNASDWITQEEASVELPVEKIAAPTLLIWGDSDQISPVSVGEHLAERIPNSQLHVLSGGDHELAINNSSQVANLIRSHLA